MGQTDRMLAGYYPETSMMWLKVDRMAECEEKYQVRDMEDPPVQCKQFELVHSYLQK